MRQEFIIIVCDGYQYQKYLRKMLDDFNKKYASYLANIPADRYKYTGQKYRIEIQREMREILVQGQFST